LCEPGRVGGTCVIRGCIPKKLMRYGAVFPDHFKAAAGYGWRLEPPRLEWTALIDARDREIARLNGVYIDMLEKAGVELFKARGIVTGAHEVEVEGERHRAERIVIAVGGRPSLPELMRGFREKLRYFDTETYSGAPAAANAELGRRFLDVLAGYTADALEELWTEAREERAVRALAAAGIAFEISNRYRPHQRFVRRAHDAGVRISLGSDGHTAAQVADVAWPLSVARAVGVPDEELYDPAVHGSRTGYFAESPRA